MSLGLLTPACNSLDNFIIGMEPRPQEPGNRPYVVREVQFPGGTPDIVLAGELTVPSGGGPFPALVLVAGSGANSRNCEYPQTGHKHFLVLSHLMTMRGYVVLRYDERGIGESRGGNSNAIDDDYAADAAAALTWLREKSGVSLSTSGYMGYSGGGIKASLAAKIERPDFMVILAGPAQKMSDVMIQQSLDLAKAAHASDADLKRMEHELRDIIEIMHSSTTLEEAREGIRNYGLKKEVSKAQIEQVVGDLATPELFAGLDRDPISLLQAYDGPVLSLYGDKDLLVSSEVNAPLMRSALQHRASEVRILLGYNHLFQQAKKGGPEEYWKIKMTFDEGVVEKIDDWVDRIIDLSGTPLK